ncbi:hypothetical protein [Nocardia tengchongensis]|uniref:hypothetical protein n=1 Tax=Nocardia tengchongensis TaxID=2055889 RepID=UPI003615BD6A
MTPRTIMVGYLILFAAVFEGPGKPSGAGIRHVRMASTAQYAHPDHCHGKNKATTINPIFCVFQ